MAHSEIARIREQIRLEYEATSRILHDFTPTARHEFITKRQENIERCFVQLQAHMTTEEAMTILIQVEQQVYQSGNLS
jgi:hypothetical protein